MAKITQTSSLFLLFLAVSIWQASARFGGGNGRGNGGGKGGGNNKKNQSGGGRGNGGSGNQNRGRTIRNLFNHHELIDRDSEETPEGIVATTTSEDEDVADWIKTHVEQMEYLMHDTDGYIRRWDPLFEAAFDLRDFHDITVDYLGNGVRVTQSVAEGVEGDELKCAKAIILAHANVVDNFARIGHAEAEKTHPVPSECDGILV